MPEDKKPGLVLRWFHIVTAIAVWLITLGVGWGILKTQVNDAATDIQEIKSQMIQRNEYNEMRDDLRDRVRRLEFEERRFHGSDH